MNWARHHVVAILVILSGAAVLAGAQGNEPAKTAPAYSFNYTAAGSTEQILAYLPDKSVSADVLQATNANAWVARASIFTQDDAVRFTVRVERGMIATSGGDVSGIMREAIAQEGGAALKGRVFIYSTYPRLILYVFAESDGKAKEYFAQAVDAINAWWKAHRADGVKETLAMLQKEVEKHQATLADAEKRYADAKKVLGDLPEHLGGTEGDQAIATMKVQLVSMDIEMTGLKTKIEAAKKALMALGPAGPQPSAQRIAIEGVLVPAQIDMAALEARQQRAQNVLESYESMRQLDGQMAGERERISSFTHHIEEWKQIQHAPVSPLKLAGDASAVVDLFPIKKATPADISTKKGD